MEAVPSRAEVRTHFPLRILHVSTCDRLMRHFYSHGNVSAHPKLYATYYVYSCLSQIVRLHDANLITRPDHYINEAYLYVGRLVSLMLINPMSKR